MKAFEFELKVFLDDRVRVRITGESGWQGGVVDDIRVNCRPNLYGEIPVVYVVKMDTDGRRVEVGESDIEPERPIQVGDRVIVQTGWLRQPEASGVVRYEYLPGRGWTVDLDHRPGEHYVSLIHIDDLAKIRHEEEAA